MSLQGAAGETYPFKNISGYSANSLYISDGGAYLWTVFASIDRKHLELIWGIVVVVAKPISCRCLLCLCLSLATWRPCACASRRCFGLLLLGGARLVIALCVYGGCVCLCPPFEHQSTHDTTAHAGWTGKRHDVLSVCLSRMAGNSLSSFKTHIWYIQHTGIHTCTHHICILHLYH